MQNNIVGYKEIKVLVEETYIVPMLSEDKSIINGWGIKQVMMEWFKRFDINRYHATRDTSMLGNSKIVLAVYEGDYTPLTKKG